MNQVIRRATLAAAVPNVLAGLIATGVASAQPVDPCKDVDVSEIGSALGHASAPAMQPVDYADVPQNAGRMWGCNMTWGELEEEGFDGVLAIQVFQAETTAAADAVLTKMVQMADDEIDLDGPMTAQSGVGDRAFWGSGADVASCLARKGRRVLGVVLIGERTPQLGEPLKRLMISTLAKL